MNRSGNINFCIIFERIKRIQAQKNPEDSKYPISLAVDIVPTSIYSINNRHKDFLKIKNGIILGREEEIIKTINIQGDYAKRGSTGVKTLRLKIKKEEWPEEWLFPSQELDRRLFLQNFRLSNLDMITPYDEGGEKYKDLFPPAAEIPIEVDFEDEESYNSFEEESSVSEEENTKTNEEKIIEVLEALDYLAEEARDEGELEFAAIISETYRTLLKDALKNKNKR